MGTYLGIDVGTSAVKAVLVDEAATLLAEAEVPLSIDRPQPAWSEQNPDDWWRAVEAALSALRRENAAALAATAGIGLSGQMHAALLLDAGDRPLRPALLWNDGRAVREAAELAARSGLAAITGVLPMAGFTAPKVVWLARHAPQTMRAARRSCSPKDYIRLKLTGERATTCRTPRAPASSMRRRATGRPAPSSEPGIGRSLLPRLVEGSAASGRVMPGVAARLGLPAGVVVAGGAGRRGGGSDRPRRDRRGRRVPVARHVGAALRDDSCLSAGARDPRPRLLPRPARTVVPDGGDAQWRELPRLRIGASCRRPSRPC